MKKTHVLILILGFSLFLRTAEAQFMRAVVDIPYSETFINLYKLEENTSRISLYAWKSEIGGGRWEWIEGTVRLISPFLRKITLEVDSPDIANYLADPPGIPEKLRQPLHLVVLKGSRENFLNNKGRNLLIIHGITTSWFDFMGPSDFVNFFAIQNSTYDNILFLNYPSGDSIMKNASDLYNLLIRDSPGVRFDIVSHSMGGLVARCIIERCYLPEELKATDDFRTNVDELFMVGTPNFGSPIGLYMESCPYLGIPKITDELCLSKIQRLLDLFPGAQQLLPTSEFLTKILNSSPKSIIAARRSSNTRYYWLSGSFSDSNLCSTGRSDGWVCMPSKTEITFLGLGDENTKTFEADHSSLHANCILNGVCSEIVKRIPPSPPRNLKVR